METAARPVRAQLRGVLLLHCPVRGSYRSTMVQGSDPCSCSLPVLPPMTYSLPPTQATLQLERACCKCTIEFKGTSTRAHSFRQEANIDRWCSDTEESMAGGR